MVMYERCIDTDSDFKLTPLICSDFPRSSHLQFLLHFLLKLTKDPKIKSDVITSLSLPSPPPSLSLPHSLLLSLYLDIDPSVWLLSQLQLALVVLAQQIPNLLLVYLQVGHSDKVFLILCSINVSENVLK